MDLAHPAFGWWPSCKKIGLSCNWYWLTNQIHCRIHISISSARTRLNEHFSFHIYIARFHSYQHFLCTFLESFSFEFLTLFHVTLLMPQGRGESARIIKGVMINKNNPSKFGLWIIITRQIRFYKQLEQSHLGCITFSKNLNTYQWSF